MSTRNVVVCAVVEHLVPRCRQLSRPNNGVDLVCNRSLTIIKHAEVISTYCDLEHRPFQLKIDTPLTRAMKNVYTNFDFYAFFVSELRACM